MKRELCLEIVRGSTSYTVGIDQPRGIIGRGPLADIRLPFATISGAHIEFKKKDQLFFFRDLGSTNGTFIDGEKIEPNKWLEITEETVLEVVDTQLIFRFLASKTPHFTMNQSGTLARKLLMDVLSSEEEAFLEAISGPNTGSRLALHDGIQNIEIGGATGDFNFPPMTPAVVATIVRDGDGFSIIPKDTIIINGIPTSAQFRLFHTTEIEMGTLRFIFTDPLEAHFLEIDKALESPAVRETDSGDIPRVDKREPKSERPKIDKNKELPSNEIPQEKKSKVKKDGLFIVVFLMVVLTGFAVVVGVLSL